MSKIIKKLPLEDYFLCGLDAKKDRKKVLYLGTSDLISEHRTDIFNTKYAISKLICPSCDKAQILKIGVTKDLDTRLKYYHKEIKDFRILKSWNIKNPTTLEQRIVSDNYKNGFTSYGSEWFWDTRDDKEGLISEIEWYIENSYHAVRNGYKTIFK